MVTILDCRSHPAAIDSQLSRRSVVIELPVTFKARSYFKLVGAICTVLFSLIGLWSVWVALDNSDGSFKNPLLAATVFGVFWSCFLLLGLYILLISRNYRLVVDNATIDQTGAFSTCRIVIPDILSAKWRNWPSGYSVKLESRDSSMAIEFGTIQPEYRDWLVDFLRSAIPETSQVNWENFQLNPECKHKFKAASPLQRAMVFYGLAMSFVVAWICGLGVLNLLAAIVNAGYATFLLSRIRRDNQ